MPTAIKIPKILLALFMIFITLFSSSNCSLYNAKPFQCFFKALNLTLFPYIDLFLLIDLASFSAVDLWHPLIVILFFNRFDCHKICANDTNVIFSMFHVILGKRTCYLHTHNKIASSLSVNLTAPLRTAPCTIQYAFTGFFIATNPHIIFFTRFQF